jgi:anti-anti-sigma factor
MTTNTTENKKIIVKPGCNLTVSSATELRRQLKEFVDGGATDIVIDLADVKIVDSIGISVLFAAHNTLKKIGGKFSVINVSPDLEKLFRRVGLTLHFSITPAH